MPTSQQQHTEKAIRKWKNDKISHNSILTQKIQRETQVTCDVAEFG